MSSAVSKSILENLISAIAASGQLEADVVRKIVAPSQDTSRGDFAVPCFLLAKNWKVAPPEAAKRLANEIALPAGIAKVEPVGPYANFFLDRAGFARQVIADTLKAGDDVAKGSPREETVVLEYSGPNIAKPYHVGHLRNCIIGLSLDRLYRYLGYRVVTVNHLGDWGTQFGFVWAGCELWGKPKEESVEALVDLYRRATALRKAQDQKSVGAEDAGKPDVNQMARDYFLRLEAGDKDAFQFWKWCHDISVEYIVRLDRRLGINFDHYTGESFYRDKLQALEAMLQKSGILENSEGALGVDLGKKLGFVRVFAEDGRSLYITRDLAQVEYRTSTFKPDKMLYVVASTQTLHFQQIVGIFKRLNHPAADKIVHVAYGNVPGISTRNAADPDKISLENLLDEAHDRARDAYLHQVEKRPEGLDVEKVAEAVGLGAVVFEYISRSNIKEFHFKWDDALSFQGDTGPYLQYALARLNSIEGKAREAGITLDKDALDSEAAKTLGDEGAYALVAHLGRFPSVIEKAAADYEPYYIALYVLELAKLFSGVYKSLRVVGEEPALARVRLALFMTVRNVLRRGLTLIGVPIVDRM